MPKIEVLNQNNDASKTRQITITVTEDCNLRCRYCYEPNKNIDHYMDLETAKKIINNEMEADNGFTAVQFAFFGGEPFKSFELIRDVIDWFHTKNWDKEHSFYIGTNGTILNEEIRDWLRRYRCLTIGVSLDGNKHVHDLNRSNSYDVVIQNMPYFLEQWPNQPVKMTINAETIPYLADCIIDLEEKEIQFTANVVFENIWGTPENKEILLKVYEQQLDILVNYYTEHTELYPALFLDRRLEYIQQQDDESNFLRGECRWCGAGVEMIMYDTEGNSFPCHRFSPWVTGKPAPTKPVNKQKNWKPKKCAACTLVQMCPTCAGYNWEENGDPAFRTTYHCEAFKLEVLASAKLQIARLMLKSPNDVKKLSEEEKSNMMRRIDAALILTESGL
ncbi:MAG: radical SAM protein [Anaerolineaceae bacterium]